MGTNVQKGVWYLIKKILVIILKTSINSIYRKEYLPITNILGTSAVIVGKYY